MFICFDYAQKVKEMCPEKRLNGNLQKMFALKQTCIFIAFFDNINVNNSVIICKKNK